MARRSGLTAWRPVLLVALGPTALELAVSARYGYHRDELYFLAAGRHLAWGYPDQPPWVPALARVLSAIGPGSLVLLRAPSALAAAGVVVLTALIARECGAERSAQVLAASAMAVGALLLGAGHLLSTTTFDLLFWALILWLTLRVLRTGSEQSWLLVGLAVGVGLFDSNLVAFLMAAVVIGLAVAGPRAALRSPWLWLGGLLAVLMWTPYLVWQAQHGWPQFAVSRSIAAGHSGSSAPRVALLPTQLGLVSPFLAPIWIVGLVRLLRDGALRWCRAIGVAWIVLAVVFIVTGGKPYYLGGMFPALLGAGAQPTLDWLRRGRRRRAVLGTAFVLSAGSILVALPVLPVDAAHDVVKANYDLGETIGWPGYVREIAAVYRQQPAGAVLVTSNYGEAGAIERFGRRLGLPHPYSGQTGYWYWGPPPTDGAAVVAVGFEEPFLRRAFAVVRPAAQLANSHHVNNDEQGATVWVCSGQRARWTLLWPEFRGY